MDAREALSDLKQISVQIVDAVVTDADGAVEGSTLGDPDDADRLARVAAELWSACDRTRRDLGRDELTQVEAATPSGSVFLVRDGERMIAATTPVDPTVGLIFYDLKTTLRTLAESPVAGSAAAAEAGAADGAGGEQEGGDGTA